MSASETGVIDAIMAEMRESYALALARLVALENETRETLPRCVRSNACAAWRMRSRAELPKAEACCIGCRVRLGMHITRTALESLTGKR